MNPQQVNLMNVLIAPHVTEKSARVADQHKQYVFKVMRGATKAMIKRATELMFNVKVEQVRVMNVKGKTRRFGGRPGVRPDWKKAYVTLAEGHDINFMGGKE
jgi:large subunit ribosomal protein L23